MHENLLKGIAIVPVPKNTWDFTVNNIIIKAHNEAKQREFEEIVLGFKEREDEI